jgi:hypothetical protein
MDLEANKSACLLSVAGGSTASRHPRLRAQSLPDLACAPGDRQQVGAEDTGGPFPSTVSVGGPPVAGRPNPGRIPFGSIGRWHLPLGDYDLEILAWNNHGLVTGSIAAPDEIDDVARERLPVSLVERLERFEHRSIVGPKDIEEVLR